MQRRTTSRVAAVMTSAVLASLAGATTASADYVVKGRWFCKNQDFIDSKGKKRTGARSPLAGVRVAIYEDDAKNWYITKTFTDEDGRFRKFIDTDKLDADDNDEVFLSVELTTKAGGVQVFDVADAYNGPDNVDTESIENDSGVANFRTRTWHSGNGAGVPACAVFLGAKRAVDHARSAGDFSLDGGYDIVNDFPAFAPFTTTDTTRWPDDSPTGIPGDAWGGFRTSFHEHAHAMRHTLDGDLAHFLGDVGKFEYAQMHKPCKRTNPGFAFNEGWAEWWGREAEVCGDGRDLSFEGNNAVRLEVAEGCSTRRQMVGVLRKHRGAIHSLGDFLKAFAKVNPSCAKKAKPSGSAARAGAAARDLAEAEADPERSMHTRIDGLRRQRSALAGRLQEARRSRPAELRCRGASCATLADRRIAPVVLASQVEQLDLAIASAEQLLASARAQGFLLTAQLVRESDALRAGLRAEVGAVVARGRRAVAREVAGLRSGSTALQAAGARLRARLTRPGVPSALAVRPAGTDAVRRG